MDESYFETFSFHQGHNAGDNSPLYELTVTSCSPNVTIGTPNMSDGYSSNLNEAAHTFAAELERRHHEVFGHGSNIAASGHRSPYAPEGARTPDNLLQPLRKRALQRVSVCSSIASSAPSTTPSEADGSEDMDVRAVPVSGSISTISSMPDLVASSQGTRREESFNLLEFIADSEAADFENELDKAVDSAQNLSLGAYTTPQRPQAQRRGTGEQSVPATQSSFSSHLSVSNSSSPESSEGSPCTPASVFGFDPQSVDTTLVMSKEENEATLRAKKVNQANQANRHTILSSDSDGLFNMDQSTAQMAPSQPPAHDARAGLGLFGVMGPPQPNGQSLSRSSSQSGYDSLSCNPADIAPPGSSASDSVSAAMVYAQQASSSSSASRMMSSPSPSGIQNIAVPSPTFAQSAMLHPHMPPSIVRSPLNLYSPDAMYRSGSPISIPDSAMNSPLDPRHNMSVLSSSLPNPHFAPPSPSPLGHGHFHIPQRPGSSLGPMRRSSTYSNLSASPYQRTIDLASTSGSPLPLQRHFSESQYPQQHPNSHHHPHISHHAMLLNSQHALVPPSPALSARSGHSVSSCSSVSTSGLSQYTDPLTGIITKRSRGRRVPNNPDEMNNLGKSGKVYTCKVPGCGKCFKRSEHLKRHVRSIHTDDKREWVLMSTS